MPSRTTTSFEERVGQFLLEGGFITQEQLVDARTAGGAESSSLLDAMVSYGMVAQETLVTVFSFQFRIPVVDLTHVQVDPEDGMVCMRRAGMEMAQRGNTTLSEVFRSVFFLD